MQLGRCFWIFWAELLKMTSQTGWPPSWWHSLYREPRPRGGLHVELPHLCLLGLLRPSSRRWGVFDVYLPWILFWEHFRDIERTRHSHGYTEVSCFSKVDASMLVMTAVALGPKNDMLCLERMLIRMVSPWANATDASVKGWRHQVMYAALTTPETQAPTQETHRSHGPFVSA